MWGNIAGLFSKGAGAAGGAAAGGGGGFMGGLKGFGERLGNFGVTDGMRAQMGEDGFKKYRSDQMWNLGASLQGNEGGRDPSQHLIGAQQQMNSLDMNQLPAPQPTGRNRMLGRGLGFGLDSGRGAGMGGGGLLDLRMR